LSHDKKIGQHINIKFLVRLKVTAVEPCNFLRVANGETSAIPKKNLSQNASWECFETWNALWSGEYYSNASYM
jgi:hypothetical protein